VILPVEVREKLKAERGIYVTEACDQCGALLGPLRWTRAGEPGVWCQRSCRDGAESEAQRKKAKGGRPRKHKTNAEKCRAYRGRRAHVSGDTKPVCTILNIKELESQNQALSYHPTRSPEMTRNLGETASASDDA
jgi:hypothetical protein